MADEGAKGRRPHQTEFGHDRSLAILVNGKQLTQHGKGIKPVTTPMISPKTKPMPAPSSAFTTTSVQWHAADQVGDCAGVAHFGVAVWFDVVLMISPSGER